MNNKPVLSIADYVKTFSGSFPDQATQYPWDMLADIVSIITKRIETLGSEYSIDNGVAIHRDARVEQHVVLKAPVIISAGCFVGAHAYIRGGVFLAEGVSVGPGCEIKSSIIMQRSALAHFNFVGDSLVGSGVNMEAGSIIANHYNERKQKGIDVMIDGYRHTTGVTKFGALVGDGVRIGANAVLSPGTILYPEAIVRRLELVEQVNYLE